MLVRASDYLFVVEYRWRLGSGIAVHECDVVRRVYLLVLLDNFMVLVLAVAIRQILGTSSEDQVLDTVVV